VIRSAEEFTDAFESIVANMSQVIKGKGDVIRMMLVALLAEGHVLLEDMPGTGKTMMARALRQSIDAKVNRVQCTPDLLPSDITGSPVFDTQTNTFNFRPGPGLRQRPARRRGQPRDAEDAVGAARGDAGEAGLGLQRDLRPADAVPRPRDAEPDRARRHVPAARGAARPLPAQAQRRLRRAAGRARPARRQRRGPGDRQARVRRQPRDRSSR
jgi:hypothetical protein